MKKYIVQAKQDDVSMTYNEVKRYLAETTGGRNTKKYSNTNVENVRKEIHTNKQ
ncbi:gamma-type small acid-soluble spore protein [Pontibacillus yanchengensis]|uniref:Gamma-type small acid-soluble spore protein n=2 Tax=Pontibacillus yanchengensis TaxID=462910 RepID=A0ACC7VJU7_9BACI|nr:gamma-type small acid-soluble spore protein [Pontibacillus yanchengensis]MYL34552.1 gamma-type small acid-soluble spore protein [Pontibacillus yanchengensis]MYL54419.1 gamma-type small acid-soluble spore protein [Pontibacillus yanchengensis]